MTPTIPSSPQAILQQAVENLYLVFGAYPLSSLEGCPCCVSATDKEQVTHRSLRELTEDDLGRYAGKAMTTWGTVDDFKHFLPRLFELTAAFQAPYEEYVVFSKLDYGHWRTWPPTEIAAIEQYFLALWDVVLGIEAWQFRDYFTALAGIYPRFDELLQHWEASTAPGAWALLGEEVYEHSQSLFRDKYFNGPFLASPQLSQRFRAWVTSPAVRDRLLEAFSLCSEDVAEKLAVAYDLIDYELKHSR
ncbi:hypothetical protein [Hymenobacter psychrotolerans]|uniref:Uncharacterized protein n=1 Tax=Hymenobacter psychrotolerans DSM 18569 TaxID=1121959 RepID=A0A1M7HMV9_9BACT|nr:hypothetical protein [Hymenobacter psychrotolerans]SHM29770.1 hypothetical protein SAMN02746009_04254 [Hymenobacter psychrotolerans DSM 18569]